MGFTNKQNKITYFNFAIQLLENFLKEKETVLENIFDYAIYVKATSLYSKSELRNGEIALSYFGVASRDLETTLKVGKLLYGSFPQNSPKVGLNTKIWMAYLKKNKTEFEDVTLLAFLALKSILGIKQI
ncbi:MAG: hypothetical protein WCG45_03375 [bacterium]